MSVRILAASSPGEVRVAVADGDALVEYAIWRPGAPDGVGDVHVGRVRAVAPAMAGAFVALDGAEGFLPDSAGAAGRGEGDVIGVRVVRAAQGGKGPRLAAEAVQGAQGLVRRGPGAVERFAALYPEAEILTDDPGLVASLRPVLGGRVRATPVAFDDAIETAVQALESATVDLPGGGRMHVQPTAALTAIDLDAGAATGERRGKQAAQLAANRAALPVLAAQIRLRNLSGAILVDLAGLSVKARAGLGREIAAVLERDRLAPRFLGFTGLGFAEILRPRVHPPLHELLAGPHAAGLAALRRIATEAAARPEMVFSLRAGPDVVAALRDDPVALGDLARRTGRGLEVRADPGLGTCGWVVEPGG